MTFTDNEIADLLALRAKWRGGHVLHMDHPAVREFTSFIEKRLPAFCEALLREREISAGLRAALTVWRDTCVALGDSVANNPFGAAYEIGVRICRRESIERLNMILGDEALRGAVAGDKGGSNG